MVTGTSGVDNSVTGVTVDVVLGVVVVVVITGTVLLVEPESWRRAAVSRLNC